MKIKRYEDRKRYKFIFEEPIGIWELTIDILWNDYLQAWVGTFRRSSDVYGELEWAEAMASTKISLVRRLRRELAINKNPKIYKIIKKLNGEKHL